MPPPAENDQVMMAMSTHDALLQAHIHALRQVSDGMAGLGNRFDAMAVKVDDVRERVIGLEKSDYDKHLEALKLEIKTLNAKVDALESQRDQMRGAGSLVTWLAKNAPWLVAVAAAVAAGWKLK